MGESGPEAEAPLTINQLFTQAVEQFGDRTALGWKEGEQWKHISYRDYYKTCRIAAKSFLKVRTEKSFVLKTIEMPVHIRGSFVSKWKPVSKA